MKLYAASASPFVRKVLVAAIELGVDDQIERIDAYTTPVEPDPDVAAANPVRKIPVLVTDAGEALYDSAVICEYLDAVAGGGKIVPASGDARWRVKRQEALADGLLDAAILIRYETAVRPEERCWDAWIDAQSGKIDGALQAMERDVKGVGDHVALAPIAFGCTAGNLDFRFPARSRRANHPKLAAWYETFGQRPSMVATAPPTG